MRQTAEANVRLADIFSQDAVVDSLESLSSKLTVLDDVLTMIKISQDALTSETIDKLTQKLEASSALLDYLGDPKIIALIEKLVSISDSLSRLLDRVVQMEQNGSLEKLLELSEAVGVVTDSMTESTLDHMTKKGLRLLETVDVLTDPEVMDVVPQLMGAVKQAGAQVKAESPQPMGVFALLKLLKDPAIVQGLNLMIYTLQNLANGKR